MKTMFTPSAAVAKATFFSLDFHLVNVQLQQIAGILDGGRESGAG